MDLYLLRHAIAKDRSTWQKKDRDRPLTREGVRKLRKTARGLKQLGISFDEILTSPYRRAYETAELVADKLKVKKKLKVSPALATDGSPEKLVRQLAGEPVKKDSILLVGHEPYLSRLISTLIGADRPLTLDFKKGGLCKLRTDHLRYGPCATLEWWLPPKLLKRIE